MARAFIGLSVVIAFVLMVFISSLTAQEYQAQIERARQAGQQYEKQSGQAGQQDENQGGQAGQQGENQRGQAGQQDENQNSEQ